MHYEVYQDGKGEFRWRLVAENGRVIADSAEGYTRKESLEDSLQLVKGAVADAEVRQMERKDG